MIVQYHSSNSYVKLQRNRKMYMFTCYCCQGMFMPKPENQTSIVLFKNIV